MPSLATFFPPQIAVVGGGHRLIATGAFFIFHKA